MLPHYENAPITRSEAMDLNRGDKLVFIDPRTADRRRGGGARLHETVVTFKHLDIYPHCDGIEVDEDSGTHYILKCFHKIIDEPKFAEEDFDAVFA